MQQLGGRVYVQLLREYIYVYIYIYKKQTALTNQPHWKRRATRQMGWHKPDPKTQKTPAVTHTTRDDPT